MAGSFDDDFGFILKHRLDRLPQEIDTISSTNNLSEPALFAKGLIKIYQTVISSQDSPACNFHPSCSRFSAKAISEGGIIKGALLTADRLMRCHWFAKDYYHKYYNSVIKNRSHKLYDPVKTYIRPEKHD